MGDIDDFFAKKDKKKKGIKKFSKANTDVLAKNIEESAIKEQMQQEKEITNLGDDAEENKAQQDDEEWDDYRENKKDFTGLKIDALVIEEPVSKQETDETEVNEHGELVKKEESGPWNKKDVERANSNEKEDSPVVESKPVLNSEQPNVVGGTYVPPGRRGGGADTAQPSLAQRPRRMKAAPDLSSQLNFPSLSSAAEDVAPKGAWGKKLLSSEEDFKDVRCGFDGNQLLKTEQRQNLALGNKFSGLDDE